MSWLDDEAPALDWLGTHEERGLVPRCVSPIAVPTEATERNALLEKAWNNLRDSQQLYLDSLRKHNFSKAHTLRALEKTGDAPQRSTVHRWGEDPDFAFVLKVMKTIAREEIVDPDRLLLRADDIAEKAMEGETVFDKEGKIVGHRPQLDTALRANEQLMKTQRMLGNDDVPKSFAEGPALIIQVVQADGKLVDVLPKGVVVDLPEPEDGN